MSVVNSYKTRLGGLSRVQRNEQTGAYENYPSDSPNRHNCMLDAHHLSLLEKTKTEVLHSTHARRSKEATRDELEDISDRLALKQVHEHLLKNSKMKDSIKYLKNNQTLFILLFFLFSFHIRL